MPNNGIVEIWPCFHQMGQVFLVESHSQTREQLMRAKEGISYPLKGFALILQVSIGSLQLWNRIE